MYVIIFTFQFKQIVNRIDKIVWKIEERIFQQCNHLLIFVHKK
jgi:hypothetical protein